MLDAFARNSEAMARSGAILARPRIWMLAASAAPLAVIGIAA
jgi:hypothetical protein